LGVNFDVGNKIFTTTVGGLDSWDPRMKGDYFSRAPQTQTTHLPLYMVENACAFYIHIERRTDQLILPPGGWLEFRWDPKTVDSRCKNLKLTRHGGGG